MPRNGKPSPHYLVSPLSHPRLPISNSKWTREQLLKSLEVAVPPHFSSPSPCPLTPCSLLQILGPLTTPLPPDLPPSPPSSRSNSPVLLPKRKHIPSQEPESTKRPRISSASDKSSQHNHYHYNHYQRAPQAPPQFHRSSSQPSNFNLRSEPSEDGELKEEPVSLPSRPSALPVVSPAVPVRRPRRGKMSSTAFDDLHDRYYKYGRMLKYSGDARFWSTYPSTHKEYRPLANPPSPNSSYHKYGGLIARLELVDSLVCFTYSLWSRDYSRRNCHRDTWSTIEAFLGWCKNKWQSEDTFGDREKALLGLIWMIEAFIRARTFYYMAKTIIDPELDRAWAKMKSEMVALSREAEKSEVASGGTASQLANGSQKTPPMLPSPASIAPASSANSTPITTSSDSTPSTSSNTLVASQTSSTSSSRSSHAINPAALPLPPHLLSHVPSVMDGRAPTPAMVSAAAKATVPFGPATVHGLKEQSTAIIAASYCMDQAQRYLSLPIIAQHYPTTFARMMGSSLAAHEEHEPDIEDEEGELLWPTQAVTGEGLGWVCLMGKAMIKEFGKDFGYTGLAGVVRKPDAAPAGASPLLLDSSRHMSVQR
ncbi:hypothetical protein ID866_743 [Astraeus odoratus]|nr:hypothetical protein ID866_743 [Astraeus odoratus]